MVESSWHVVEVVFDESEGYLADVEVGSFGQPSAEHSVGVFVGGPLPGRAGLAEVDGETGALFDVAPVGHLSSFHYLFQRDLNS